MEVVKYDVTSAWISEAKAKYASLACDSTAGYEEVRLAIADVRGKRIAVENQRVALKAEALAYGRKVDSVAKDLTDALMAIENPLKAKKDVVDGEKARIKAEKEAAELAAIEAKIKADREAEEARLKMVREVEELALKREREKLAEERAIMEARQKAIDEQAVAVAAAQRAQEAALRKAQEELNAQMRAAERAEFERKARLEAMKPDKEKLKAFSATISRLQYPEVKSEAARNALSQAADDLAEICFNLDSFCADPAPEPDEDPFTAATK